MKSHRLRTATQIQVQAKELRQRMTPSEIRFWSVVRGRKLDGLKFRRQHPIRPYIVDFYCAEHRIVIEIDGHIHDSQAKADIERTVEISERGYTVIRFTNEEVDNHLDQVLMKIRKVCPEIKR